MKTESKILTAFILNLAFSIFEFVGGVFTGSVAIISDAVHDLGDAAGIGAAFFLERKSKKQPDEKYSCTVLFALSPIVGMWLFWLTFFVMLVVIIAGVIYANTGNRFKKK